MARETSTFKSKTINNNSGNIMAQDALDINASHRVNYSYNNPTNEYGVFSGGGTNLNLSSTLNNDHSRIVSNGNINITPGYWHSQ